MHPHHQRTIQRMISRFQPDPAALALIIIGSVARGDARADSDVDCYLLMDDQAYQSRRVATTYPPVSALAPAGGGCAGALSA
jgi:predicted nucleotidyltransferase